MKWIKNIRICDKETLWAFRVGPHSHTAVIYWADGTTDLVDFSELIAANETLKNLSDPDLFETMNVNDDGTSLIWKNDISLDAFSLWCFAREKYGTNDRPLFVDQLLKEWAGQGEPVTDFH